MFNLTARAPAHYDWSRLDSGLDLLVQNGMTPIFELMGNPNGHFNDFNNDLQLHQWRSLVRDLGLHLMERYGESEVEGWLFETWNEPDIGFGWQHQWPRDEQSFCNYYDACTAGLEGCQSALENWRPGQLHYPLQIVPGISGALRQRQELL
jgi:L-iduronidase